MEKNDEIVRKKNRRFNRIISMVVGVSFGIYIVSSPNKAYLDSARFLYQMFCFFIMFYIGQNIHIVVHELGHLCFGLLTGYRFLAIALRNVIFVKEKGKLKIHLTKNGSAGGFCMMQAPELKNGSMPFVLFECGGILANACLSIIFLILLLYNKENSNLLLIYFSFVISGIVIVVMNGMPRKTISLFTDGYNLRSLLNSSKAVCCFWMQTQINSQTISGVRLRDMPDEWFAFSMEDDFSNNVIATIVTTTCSRLIDQQLFSEASQLMEQVLDMEMNITEMTRHYLICECLFVEIIGANRSEVIDEIFDQEQESFMKSMKNSPAILRTVYAYVLLVEDNLAEAKRLREMFDRKSATYHYQMVYDGEKELFNIVDQIYQERKSLTEGERNNVIESDGGETKIVY